MRMQRARATKPSRSRISCRSFREVTQHPKERRVAVHVDATLTSLTLIACGIAYTSRIARCRGLDRPTDFGAAGAQDNTRGFSTLQTQLSGVAGCGRSALLVRIDLDVRTVRIECHFNDVARGLCLWSGSRQAAASPDAARDGGAEWLETLPRECDPERAESVRHYQRTPASEPKHHAAARTRSQTRRLPSARKV